MKNKTLLCALTLLIAAAASGCGSSEFSSIDGSTSDFETPEVVAPVADSDTITPTDPAGDVTTTDPATPQDPGPGLPVCDATHPPPCIIVDPAPGGVRPDVTGPLTDISDDTTPPPSDGSGGGGYNGGSDGVGCHFQGPTGGGGNRRMRQQVGPQDEAADILSRNDCIML